MRQYLWICRNPLRKNLYSDPHARQLWTQNHPYSIMYYLSDICRKIPHPPPHLTVINRR